MVTITTLPYHVARLCQDGLYKSYSTNTMNCLCLWVQKSTTNLSYVTENMPRGKQLTHYLGFLEELFVYIAG